MAKIYYVLKQTNEGAYIFDTSDYVTDFLTNQECRRVMSMGFKLTEFNKTNIILHKDLNENGEQTGDYYLTIYGCKEPIYYGSFPKHNNRNDLIGFDIHIKNVELVDNFYYVEVVCNVWCKYDIEIPMVMSQLIRIPIKKVKETFVSLFMSHPVCLLSRAEFNYMMMLTQGDYPSDCALDADLMQRNNFNPLRYFNVQFKGHPYGEDLCKHLNYIRG